MATAMSFATLFKVGDGTFGTVDAARHRATGRVVALKRIRFRDVERQATRTVLREVQALHQCAHDNVVGILPELTPDGSGVVPGPSSLTLVLEFCATDLRRVLRSGHARLPLRATRTYARHLFRGLAHMHSLGVCHRDIKPGNLLIQGASPAALGVLKLADFGLARAWPSGESLVPEARMSTSTAATAAATVDAGAAVEAEMTQQVATRWYRAPELLFGATCYGPGVDVWAAGAVVAEMLQHRVLFPGDNDIDQIHRLFVLLGTPTPSSWPGAEALPDFKKIAFDFRVPQRMENVLLDTPREWIDLVRGTVRYDPKRRLGADAVLRLPCLREQEDHESNGSLGGGEVEEVAGDNKR